MCAEVGVELETDPVSRSVLQLQNQPGAEVGVTNSNKCLRHCFPNAGLEDVIADGEPMFNYRVGCFHITRLQGLQQVSSL